MRKFTILSLVAIFSFAALQAEAPKREVRAVWLTSAWALDWPSVRVPSPVFDTDGVTILNEEARAAARTQQQNQLLNIVERMYAANFNTIYFQVRPMADAFFRSSFEPWSHWLSSNENGQGHVRGVYPGWDPLEFIIYHAHARGMEVHAWLNPYRYRSSTGTFTPIPTDFSNTHPHWLLDYTGIGRHNEGSMILNPGIPEVRNLISDIVEELIRNYNLDGIVLDDYFYQTGTTDEMDQAQFDAYPIYGITDRHEWRREQINLMVAEVQQRILDVAPWVQWGISPAGVVMGRNIPEEIIKDHGITRSPGIDWQFEALHSDPVMWLRRGTVDYISPQIYWPIGSGENTDYEAIATWWSKVANQFGRHLFTSNTNTFAYRFAATLGEIHIPTEIERQTKINRREDRNGVTGIVLFRERNSHTLGVYSGLRENLFRHPALPANFGWKEAPMQGLVENLRVSGRNVSWTYTSTDPRVDVRYAVYAVPRRHIHAPDAFSSPRYLVGISYTTNFTLPAGINSISHVIGVAVFDRFGNLFAPRTVGGKLTSIAPANLNEPIQGHAQVARDAIFTWEPNGAHKYVWQLAYDADFTMPIASRETVNPYFNFDLQGGIQSGATYYWRVISIRANAEPSISEVRVFRTK